MNPAMDLKAKDIPIEELKEYLCGGENICFLDLEKTLKENIGDHPSLFKPAGELDETKNNTSI